jgi:hypothetical protein
MDYYQIGAMKGFSELGKLREEDDRSFGSMESLDSKN